MSDEGLSYLVTPEHKFTLKDAVAAGAAQSEGIAREEGPGIARLPHRRTRPPIWHDANAAGHVTGG